MKYFFLVLMAAIICWSCNQNSNTVDNADTTSVQDAGSIIKSDTGAATTAPAAGTQTETSSNKTIIAGKSIGNVELGMNDSLIETILGKPDMSDAAMGKAWLTWYGKKPDDHNNKTQLNIFTSYKDTSMREKTIKQVRTTSSFFETENGLHVYSSFNEIQSKFPNIKKVAAYNEDGRKFMVYDAQQKGIAFEVAEANAQQLCSGIIIHKPGDKVTQVYLSLHPDMHVF